MTDLLDRRVDAALADLAVAFDARPASDVASAVRRRLERSGRVVLPRRRFGAGQPRWALAVAAALAAMLVVSLPAPRAAVADWLGIGGVRVSRSNAPIRTPFSAVELGAPTTLRGAAEEVGFRVLVPTSLEAPDAVGVSETPAGPRVSLVWSAPHPRAAGGGVPDSDVAILVTGFRALPEYGLVSKEVGLLGDVEPAMVRGHSGLWVEAPHAYGETGAVAGSDFRRAGPTLLWDEDGIVWRIEGVADLADALDVAASMR